MKKVCVLLACVLMAVTLVTVSTSAKDDAYKVGDRGPGGGIIYFIEGDIYREVSGNLGNMMWSVAKRTARNHTGGGFGDWVLPNSSELRFIHQSLTYNVGEGLQGTFWSRTESRRRKKAWALIFPANSVLEARTYSTFGVIAIRTFTQ